MQYLWWANYPTQLNSNRTPSHRFLSDSTVLVFRHGLVGLRVCHVSLLWCVSFHSSIHPHILYCMYLRFPVQPTPRSRSLLLIRKPEIPHLIAIHRLYSVRTISLAHPLPSTNPFVHPLPPTNPLIRTHCTPGGYVCLRAILKTDRKYNISSSSAESVFVFWSRGNTSMTEKMWSSEKMN